MSKKIFIAPYKMGSKSAKQLANTFGAKRIKTEGSSYKVKPSHVVLNWGRGEDFTDNISSVAINPPSAIAMVSNKLKFFLKMKEEGLEEIIPPFTDSLEQAIVWKEKADAVVERHKLQGHSGEGIRIVEGDMAVQVAPLYTKYLKKKDEYRIHCARVGNDLKIFDIQRKARRKDTPDEEVNWQVRNHENGFIYARDGFEAPKSVLDVAAAIFSKTGLDFGAVDIIYNESQDRAYALEVNTAPGLEGTTLDNYVNVLSEIFLSKGVSVDES